MISSRGKRRARTLAAPTGVRDDGPLTRHRARRVRIWFFAILALTCIACAGLLGLDDVSYVASDASALDAETRTDGSQTSDGGTADGPSACDPDGSDPLNCGQCGRVCAGCEAGMCTPEVVVDLGDAEAAQLIAADDAGVYFTTSTGPGSASHLRAVGTSPAAPRDIGPLPFQAGAIALLGPNVYVASSALTSDGGVFRCDRSGVGCSPYVGAATPVRGLGASDTAVYVTDGASLRSFAGDGGFFVSLYDAGANDDLGPLGVSDDNFWCVGGTVSFSTHMLRCKNNVYRYGFQNQPRAVLVAEDDVYWSETEIHSMHRDGGVGVSFGNGQPVQFAADATHLYWIGASVLSCPRSTGCGTGFHASANTNSSGAIAVAGGYVYWTEMKSPAGRPGRVLRVPVFK